MQNQPDSDLRSRFSLDIAIHLEIFYAMQTVTDPDSRIHREWTTATRHTLPARFEKAVNRLGGWPDLWPMIADALPHGAPIETFDELVRQLRGRNARAMQSELLYGVIHFRDLVDGVLDGTLSLNDAVNSAANEKREWYAFIGLFPFDNTHPFARGLQLLIDDPESFRAAAIDALETFWKHGFEETWREVQPQLQRSRAAHQRLFDSCTFDEFVRESLIRIEVDYAGGVLRAVRGGAETPFDRVERGFIMPSLFNDHRLWTQLEQDGRVWVYIPYFDPDMAPSRARSIATRHGEASLDPALIFKALGDPTRFAMVSLIAREQHTATALSRTLGVTKPTVSHHIHILREAGLIDEAHTGGSVNLSLRRHVIEQLSNVTLQRLGLSLQEVQR